MMYITLNFVHSVGHFDSFIDIYDLCYRCLYDVTDRGSGCWFFNEVLFTDYSLTVIHPHARDYFLYNMYISYYFYIQKNKLYISS